MAFKVAGFDWNGTLMNDWELMYAVVVAHCEAGLGIPPTKAEFIRHFHPPYLDYVRSRGSMFSETQNWGAWEEMAKHYTVAPHKVVRPLLERLSRQKIPIYLISANQRARVEEGLIRHGLRPFFEALYADAEFKHSEIVSVLTTHGLRPAEMFYAGDMPIDMIAAKKAGVVGIGIGSAAGHEDEHCAILKEAGATYTFPSLAAFHDAIMNGLG